MIGQNMYYSTLPLISGGGTEWWGYVLVLGITGLAVFLAWKLLNRT